MSGSIALSRVFFLFICSLGTTLAANCDQDFVYIEGLGCYHVNSEATMNWEDAKDYCAARNSYLVSSFTSNIFFISPLKLSSHLFNYNPFERLSYVTSRKWLRSSVWPWILKKTTGLA